MALTRTAQQLEDGARRRADMIGSTFRDATAIRAYLSASCRELVSILSRVDDYWLSFNTINTTPSQDFTTVPNELWKLVSLRLTLNGTREKLKRASVDELGSEVTFIGWEAFGFPRYRVRGQYILWYPTPIAVHSVTLEYLPHAIFRDNTGAAISQFAAATDTFDGVFGWDNWAEIHTAIKLRADAGKDTADLRAELAAAQEEMVLAAMDRDLEEPQRIRDTWRSDEESDYG